MTESDKKQIVWFVFAVFIVILVWSSWEIGKKPLPTTEDLAKKTAKDEYFWCVKQSEDTSRSPLQRQNIAAECWNQREAFNKKYGELL